MRDLQVVLFLVDVTVRAVVVLVLKVLETLLLVERSEQLPIADLHLDHVHGERWQVRQRLNVLADLQLEQLLVVSLPLCLGMRVVLMTHVALLLRRRAVFAVIVWYRQLLVVLTLSGSP